MLRVLLLLVLLAALPVAPALAQCAGPSGVPFNCLPLNAPQPGDYVMGGSNTAPQAGDTGRWTWAQVFATFGGNVTSAGSPISGQLAEWSTPTSITGLSLGTGVVAALQNPTNASGGFLTYDGLAGYSGTVNGLTAGTALVANAANALNSATTTVVVNGSTAPMNGQVLTASSSTAAAWQTPPNGITITGTPSTNQFAQWTSANSLQGTTLGTAALINTGTSGATIPLLNGTNVWSGQNSGTVTTLAISSTTFTPNNASNNYYILLTTACDSAACTLSDFSSTPPAGTVGQIVVQQPASGGPAAFGTYGTTLKAPGGTSTITYSTGANAIDILSYYSDGTSVYLVPASNFSH